VLTCTNGEWGDLPGCVEGKLWGELGKLPGTQASNKTNKTNKTLNLLKKQYYPTELVTTKPNARV